MTRDTASRPWTVIVLSLSPVVGLPAPPLPSPFKAVWGEERAPPLSPSSPWLYGEGRMTRVC